MGVPLVEPLKQMEVESLRI